MRIYFESISETSKEEFIAEWEKEEKASGNIDPNTNDRIEAHRGYSELKYYVGKLAENGFAELFLPYHSHANNEVARSGEPFWDVIDRYFSRIQQGQSGDCLDRLCLIRSEFDNLLVDYTLGRVFNDPELAMAGHYRNYGKNKFYVGNFHRFVAYGLWIIDSGFQPMKLFYCEKV